jgi:apolipoprotein N-acyltransferase
MNLGGAICYDYDFPYLAKEYGNIKADLVALPSSDWRGIDPLHTRMAAYRAIEQGHSILRSTRFGLSAAINPYGEMLSQMSSFDNNNKMMISQLPVKGIRTIYSIIGDILVYLCIAFIPFFFIVKKP